MALDQGGNKAQIPTAGYLGDIDASARNAVGLEVPDNAGNMYKYMGGVASLAAGDWVVFNSDGTVTRSLDTPIPGPMGVAMAAVLAGQFGWFQIIGFVAVAGNGIINANIATSVAANLPLFLTSTAGRLGSSAAAGKAVLGAYSATATSASNFGNAWISRPFAPGFTLANA